MWYFICYLYALINQVSYGKVAKVVHQPLDKLDVANDEKHFEYWQQRRMVNESRINDDHLNLRAYIIT